MYVKGNAWIKNDEFDYKLPIFSQFSHTTSASRGIETSSPTTTVSVRRQTNVTYTPSIQQSAFSETQTATVKAPSEESVSEFQPLVPYNFTEVNSSTEDPFKQFNSLYPSESPKASASSGSKQAASETVTAINSKSTSGASEGSAEEVTPDYWAAYHSSFAAEESQNAKTTAKPEKDDVHDHKFPYSHFSSSWPYDTNNDTNSKQESKKDWHKTAFYTGHNHTSEPFDYTPYVYPDESTEKAKKKSESSTAQTTVSEQKQRPNASSDFLKNYRKDSEGHATNDDESDHPEEKPEQQKKQEAEERSDDEEEEDDEKESSSKKAFFDDSDKFIHIDNPFADPNFDFDKYLQSLKKPHQLQQQNNRPAQNPQQYVNIPQPPRQQYYAQPRSSQQQPRKIYPINNPIINEPLHHEPRGVNMETQTYHSKIEIKSHAQTQRDEDDRPKAQSKIDSGYKPQSYVTGASVQSYNPSTHRNPNAINTHLNSNNPVKLNRYPIPNYNSNNGYKSDRGPQTFKSAGTSDYRPLPNLSYNSVKTSQGGQKAPAKPDQTYYDEGASAKNQKPADGQEPLYDYYYEYYDYPEETQVNGTVKAANNYYDDDGTARKPLPKAVQDESKQANAYRPLPPLVNTAPLYYDNIAPIRLPLPKAVQGESKQTVNYQPLPLPVKNSPPPKLYNPYSLASIIAQTTLRPIYPVNPAHPVSPVNVRYTTARTTALPTIGSYRQVPYTDSRRDKPNNR